MCLWEHAVCQAAQVCSGPGCRQRFELSRVGEPPTEGTPEPQADTYRCSPYVTCSQAVVAPQACWPCCLHLLQANCFSGLLGLLTACLSSCLQCRELGRRLSRLTSNRCRTAALLVCRWARCNQALPLSYLHALGLPLPENQLAVWEPRLQWEELQVGPTCTV